MEQQLYELPEGWSWHKFGEVVANHDGKRIPIKASERKTSSGTYPYYGATGIIDYVDDFIFDGSRLLISEDGANLVARKYPIAFIATGKYWVNNHAHVVDAVAEKTSNHFLEVFFAWTDLSGYITGAAQPKLSQKKLNSIPVPLPPLNEQKRIVAKLDAIFTRIDAAITHLQETLKLSKALYASALDEVFSKAAKKFGEKPISEIFTISSGDGLTQKNMVKDGPYDVYGGNGVSGKHNKYNRSGLNVVIGRVGAWCGNVRLVEGDIWVTDNAFFVKSYLAEITESYLVTALRHLNLRSTANQAAQPVISYKIIKELLMPLPPKNEQVRLVTRLDSLAECTFTLEAEIQERLEQLTALKSSLLDAAFRGQL